MKCIHREENVGVGVSSCRNKYKQPHNSSSLPCVDYTYHIVYIFANVSTMLIIPLFSLELKVSDPARSLSCIVNGDAITGGLQTSLVRNYT